MAQFVPLSSSTTARLLQVLQLLQAFENWFRGFEPLVSCHPIHAKNDLTFSLVFWLPQNIQELHAHEDPSSLPW